MMKHPRSRQHTSIAASPVRARACTDGYARGLLNNHHGAPLGDSDEMYSLYAAVLNAWIRTVKSLVFYRECRG